MGAVAAQLGATEAIQAAAEAELIDTDGDGYISFEEFAAWWAGKADAQRKMQQVTCGDEIAEFRITAG
eukprot:COSAG01_NODE_19776_length_990_cov_0.903479_2_plen_68_part_00